MKQNYIQAYKWWNIAEANRDAEGRKKRGILEKKMSLDQINEAERLSWVWMWKHPVDREITLDLNIDGKFTITDVWLLLKTLYFLPGDYIVSVWLKNPKLTEFFELSEDSLAGTLSGVMSFGIWSISGSILFFLIFGLLVATIIGLAVSEKFQEIFWCGIGLLILYYFFPTFTVWVILIVASISIIVRGKKRIEEERELDVKFEAERLAEGNPLKFYEKRLQLEIYLIYSFSLLFVIILGSSWLSSLD